MKSAALSTAAVAVTAWSAPDPYNCSSQPSTAFTPITLRNHRGTAIEVIPYGATLTHFNFTDCSGATRDIILGFDDATQYCINAQHPYFGASIGRYANRISNGTFSLNGQTYYLPRNEKNYDTLHGGPIGFDRKEWTVESSSDGHVAFTMTSADGEDGFPGAVFVRLVYTLGDDDEWGVWYEASGQDADTIINLSQHTYWNLNGFTNDSVLEHVMSMPQATRFLPVDSHLIPTGNITAVSDAPWLDFTQAQGKPVGRDIANGTVAPGGGYDNAFVFADWRPNATNAVRPVVWVSSPLTGISMTVSTDQPSLQFYSGNFLNGSLPRKADQGPGYYGHWSAVVFEAQGLVNAINNPQWWGQWPSSILRAGETYRQTTTYRLSLQC